MRCFYKSVLYSVSIALKIIQSVAVKSANIYDLSFRGPGIQWQLKQWLRLTASLQITVKMVAVVGCGLLNP